MRTHYLGFSEAASETIFENICSFLPGAPFSGFFQEALFVHLTDANFPGRRGLFTEQIPFFQEASLCVHRADTNFPGALFWLPNRYRFSRNTFLSTEQITIFQEAFFEFQRTEIGNFQEGTPLRIDISALRSRGLLSIVEPLSPLRKYPMTLKTCS